MSKTMESFWDQGYDDVSGEKNGYGNPLSGKDAAEAFGEARGEAYISVLILENEKRKIKPRRGFPEVKYSDFSRSIVQAPDGRWFFSGVLNGWGGYSLLEIDAITKVQTSRRGTFVFGTSKREKVLWRSKSSSNPRELFSTSKSGFEIHHGNLKAKLYLPKYIDRGYSRSSPGYAWYFTGVDEDSKNHCFAHGTNMIDATREHDNERHGKLAKATRAYHFGHRYAKESESFRDKMLYHTGVFIEWDHGEYGTIVELAWRHGIGGYLGKSNWVEDCHGTPNSVLYNAMPAECKQPWDENKSEIRMIDVPLRSAKEFLDYMKKYTGAKKRFLDPKIKFSADITLKNRTKPDLCKYILNRILFDGTYSEPMIRKQSAGYNCQTFAAAFYGFLTNSRSSLFSIRLASLNSRQKWFAHSYETGKVVEIEYEKNSK